ncbi:MAG: ROK family protein [Oscillospiraceae bacterium]|nr:ROK family protein [Oscillospiraceae bacterium]
MYVGIDVGGTNIACGIVDASGKILHRESIKTESEKGYSVLVKNIAQLVKHTLKKAGVLESDVLRIGVGCPGCCNKENGIVELCINLNWRNVPLVKDLSELTGITNITIENDANAAAYGEFVAGAAKGSNSAVVITLGTGVGSGIIIDKKLLHGMNFAGGEIGHMVLEVSADEQGDDICGCGRYGCFESFSSATALVKMTTIAMENDPSSEMHRLAGEYGKISARTAWQAQRLGDKAGSEVVEKYIKYLAAGITNVINIFQPDIVCIGGGVCNEGDPLLLPLREAVAKQVYSRDNASNKNTQIAICKLGNEAGIIGAALCQ